MAGCAEIFDARSRVSAEGMAGEVTEPSAGSVKVAAGVGSMGRRGARREMERVEEGIENLEIIREGYGLGRWAGYRRVAAGVRRLAGGAEGRATARRQRRAFIMPPPRSRWRWERHATLEGRIGARVVRWCSEVQRACRRRNLRVARASKSAVAKISRSFPPTLLYNTALRLRRTCDPFTVAPFEKQVSGTAQRLDRYLPAPHRDVQTTRCTPKLSLPTGSYHRSL